MARPKNLAALTGRPTTYTVDVAAEVLTRMFEGESLHKIAQSPHIPHEATIRSWADCGRHPQFTEAFRRARRAQADRWFGETVEIADELQNAEAVHQVYAGQTRIRARQWACSRLNPEEYGERVPPAAGGGAVVHIYLPGKPDRGDSARVIKGSAEQLPDRSDEPGTDT
jgi:hypothetical protein